MGKLLSLLDDAVYRLERAVCVALLGLMTLAVFTDVVHRQAATANKLDRLLESVLPAALAIWVARVLWLGITFVLVYLAVRTASGRERSTRRSAKQALRIAALGTAGAWGAVQLLLVVFPNGLIWSQKFALACVLWVGFIGASMATKERAHLTLEIMDFAWRGRAKAHVARINSFAAAAFCLALAVLTVHWARAKYAEYADSDGMSGAFEGFEVPKFVVFSILPVTFTIMTLRFLGRAFGPTEEEKPPDLKPIIAPSGGER